MPFLTEHGVTRDQFEDFFGKLEAHSYEGFKWEWRKGEVLIYEVVGMPHEAAAHNFNFQFCTASMAEGYGRALRMIGSTRLRNPDPNESNWEPDCSYAPVARNGPFGDLEHLTPYPTMVVEVASSETDNHVLKKGRAYLSWGTTIQIVVIILIRPDLEGADTLQVWKFQRDRTDQHFRLGDPNCIAMGDPNFQLRLPVRLLFDDAPIPPALVGVENVLFDLFSFKREFLGLP
jgi:Uma2 family endonuclease